MNAIANNTDTFSYNLIVREAGDSFSVDFSTGWEAQEALEATYGDFFYRTEGNVTFCYPVDSQGYLIDCTGEELNVTRIARKG